MTLLLEELTAVQQPRVLLRPQGIVSSSGPDAVELAAVCGLILDPWQSDGLYDAMGERTDGMWAASTVGLICSRQNGKNDEVNAREVFGLSVLKERIIHSAHRFKTALESFDRLYELIHANVEVSDFETIVYRSPASGYEMRFRDGGRIVFLARSGSSGRGFAGFDLLVFDEAQDLTDDAQGAMKPTISARPNAQTWYLGSAPGIGSTVLHRIRKQGRAGTEKRLSYREHSADPDCDPDDRAAWAQANPAYPGRITDPTILTERLEMSPEMFLRERLSVSPDIDDLQGVFPAEEWAGVCSPTLELDMSAAQCFAVDINPERTYAAIVACGDLTVEVIDYRPGVGWLEDRAAELADRYRKPVVIDSKGPAGSLIAGLKQRNVTVTALTPDEMVKACGDLYDAVVNAEVRVRTNKDLNRAVAGASKRPVGDAYCWGRKTSDTDISLLVAATSAHWVATQTAGPVELIVI